MVVTVQGASEMAGWSMETTESDVAQADDESVDVPKWWRMPFPTKPLYPVDLFVSARPLGRRERSRQRGAHIRTRNLKRV